MKTFEIVNSGGDTDEEFWGKGVHKERYVHIKLDETGRRISSNAGGSCGSFRISPNDHNL